MITRRFFVSIAVATSSLLILNTAALADFGTKKHSEKWDQEHPRQAEVDQGLQENKDEIKQGESAGSLTKEQGQQLKRQNRRIFKQEQRMKRRNGGDHITEQQKDRLDQEKANVNGEIKKNESSGPGVAPVAPGSPTTPSGN